ncbi:hypothetical protein ABZX56_11130 [Streptomyces parvulus]|uniref:hypothetical protein n=1 Tax=Streptomyces parvulus TaxID=146923 RepID=UPI0033AD7FE5
MKLYIVRIDPVQEIAAEPATLDLLKDILKSAAPERPATPELLSAARLTGWPLVYDASIEPGTIHCRPTPGAPLHPSVEELTERIRAWMPDPP